MYGFGRVGRATVELALQRPWLELRAVLATSASAGIRVADVVPGAPPRLVVSEDPERELALAKPDVIIVATRSTLAEVLPHLTASAARGVPVLCTAEELAYVEPADSPQAEAVHSLAANRKVPILAVGINPGFVLDLWPLVATGLAWDVMSITARRVVDGSVFGPRVRARLGIGFTRGEFEAGLSAGTISGHLGFRESMRTIAAAMGVSLDGLTVETRPLVARSRIERDDMTIAAGQSAGTLQRAVATRDGRPWITIDFVVHVAPEADGLRTLDELTVEGRNRMHVVVEGGFKAVAGTAALLVNAIPAALRSAPGLHGPASLPPFIPWLADQPPSR